MTNQEWLGTLPPDEWWDAVMTVMNWLIKDNEVRYNHTRLAVIDWLKIEHKPIDVWNNVKQKWLSSGSKNSLNDEIMQEETV